MPGRLVDSAGRIKAASAPGGVAPTSYGPMATPLNGAGRICFNTSAPSGNKYHGGARLDANDNMFYSTTPQATDHFTLGYRWDVTDALIVAVEGTVQNYSNGDPFDVNGALVITLV